MHCSWRISIFWLLSVWKNSGLFFLTSFKYRFIWWEEGGGAPVHSTEKSALGLPAAVWFPRHLKLKTGCTDQFLGPPDLKTMLISIDLISENEIYSTFSWSGRFLRLTKLTGRLIGKHLKKYFITQDTVDSAEVGRIVRVTKFTHAVRVRSWNILRVDGLN